MTRLLCLLAVLCGVAPAHAWWSDAWTQRKPITLKTSGTGAIAGGVDLSQPLVDTPILLRLHGGNFPQFLSVRDGGADFRAVAGDDKTPLKYHVERFDPVAQIALVWVKMPILAANPQGETLALYFANAAANAGDDAAATFDADTAAVFHFGESTGLPQDSTAYKTPVTAAAIAPNTASLIGTGATFNGTGSMVIGDAPQTAIDATKGWTIETWLRFETLPAAPATVFERGAKAEQLSLTLNGGWLAVRYRGATFQSSAALTAGQWHHVALSLGHGQVQLYLDGVAVGAAQAELANLAGPIYVGAGADGKGMLSAAIDELRIHGIARSPQAIAYSAAISGERNDTLVSYGADETAGAEGAAAEGPSAGGNWSVIIGNVFGNKEQVVEQFVIGLCGGMAAIAIMVMFLKAVALSRGQRVSRRFLEAYQGAGLAGFDSLLKDEDDYDVSPLFSVYAQGFREVRTRLSPAVGAAPAGLDDKALLSIRAALDAVMVREGQRLNGMLVLLTIAISGGPFIGLLGTVVGVMMTFANIARTGDVNIAAIAPGMAAALLATVAGLGVAIPSLFGYNYLSAKAKDLSADMHVFADEFIARLNEQFGL